VRSRAVYALYLLLMVLTLRRATTLASQPWPRAGLVVALPTTAQVLDRFGPLWYYDYGFDGPDLQGHQRVYMVRPHFDEARLQRALRARPGSWWLVGNEPNDPFQDNLSPGAYAAFFHRFVEIAQCNDRSSRIVPAGIADADWRWAQAFRESYRAQYGTYPRVQAWNIHNYLLDADKSQYDVAEFQQRIVAFRDWMARIGEGHKPLLLTEYGVLYGSGCCDRPIEDPAAGVEFLRQTTRWLQETHLVQAWTWFCLDSRGQFHGDLLQPSGELSEFGDAYRETVREYLDQEAWTR
jgi:hypothetical protein